MFRIVTGLTMAALAISLFAVTLFVTNLDRGLLNNGTTTTGLAQAQVNLGTTYVTENGEEVTVDPENTLIIQLKNDGLVVIEMLPDLAPVHVRRIKELTRTGFYDGIVFHRVIDGFMAQTGDPDGTGRGGSGQKLNAEFTEFPFDRGVVGMARANQPDSGDSQFFIMFDAGYFLNGQYTVWGRVVSGMEHVDAIKRGGSNGIVSDPDRMIAARVLADVL